MAEGHSIFEQPSATPLIRGRNRRTTSSSLQYHSEGETLAQVCNNKHLHITIYLIARKIGTMQEFVLFCIVVFLAFLLWIVSIRANDI